MRIERARAEAYSVPTDGPEADGTLEWDETTIVVATVEADGEEGVGYVYNHPVCAKIIESKLAPQIVGRSALDVEPCWLQMWRAVRNLGHQGVVASAISALNLAQYDLKARLLGVSIADLLGAVREEVPLYGSGGFTSYSTERLCEQLKQWVDAGIPRVKMKIGRDREADRARVRAAREAIGERAELFVDANGAYSVRDAIAVAHDLAGHGVTWFEEPVSSDDVRGLAEVRAHAPPSMAVTAGEYGWDPIHHQRLLDARAVDVAQADVTRCLGITGLRKVDALCTIRGTPLSLHTAPAGHAHVALSLLSLCHLEYFHDHVRIESMLFDGLPELRAGCLRPRRDVLGHGFRLVREAAEPYRVS